MFLDYPDIEKFKELALTNASLTVTSRLSYNLPNGSIISSFIEHPYKPATVVACVNAESIIEFSPNGSCHTLAGQSIHNCSSAQQTSSISCTHLAAFDLMRLPSNSLPFNVSSWSMIISGDHCMRIFDLMSETLVYPPLVGRCGVVGTMSDNKSKPLDEFLLSSPAMALLMYSTNAIRIVVTCIIGDPYLTVITIKPKESFANQFLTHKSFYISSVGSIYGAVRSKIAYTQSGSMKCRQNFIIDDVDQTGYNICEMTMVHPVYTPVLFMGSITFASKGSIHVFVPSDRTKAWQAVAGLSYSATPIDTIVLAEKNGGLLLHSRLTQNFFFVNDKNSIRLHRGGTSRLERLEANFQCQGLMYKSFRVTSLDHCAYSCISEFKCRAVSFSSTGVCQLYLSAAIGGQKENTQCFIISL